MLLRFTLLILFTGLIFFIVDIIIPKLKWKYGLRKELQKRRKAQETFAKKMKELEIK